MTGKRIGSLPPVDVLARAFWVDANGTFRWMYRPEMSAHWNWAMAGKPAGFVSEGYVRVNFQRRKLHASRVIYAIWHGHDPGRLLVDHIDGNPLNNRPSNLRLATDAQNTAHQNKLRSDSTSGERGVTWKKKNGKWAVQVGPSGKGRSRHRGLFADYDEAVAHARKCRSDLFGEFRGTE